MAVLIPSLSASASRMDGGRASLGRTAGRRRADQARVWAQLAQARPTASLQGARSRQFSFKNVGIQAQGRTTALKINYRNTRQILQTASQIAGGLVRVENSEQGEDGIPLLLPVSCGREGPEPMVINLPTLHEEAAKVAELLSAARQEGRVWGDMAVLGRHHDRMEGCARALTRRRLPHRVRKGSGDFKPLEDSIKVMTIHVSKGLEFPIVAVMGLGKSSDEVEAEARLLYVAATRATQRLLIATATTDSLAQA